MIWKELENNVNLFNRYGVGESIDFWKFNLYSLVHHSAAIEGCTLTEGETELLLDKNITPEGKPLEDSNMTKDCYNALLYVIDKADTKEPFSPQFLIKVNSLVMRTTGGFVKSANGDFDVSKGEFRTVSAFAQGGSYYLSPDKIERETTVLCAEMNKLLSVPGSIADQYRLSFAAHYNLVTIHPWAEGNGRTSRLMMNFVQRYLGLPFSKVYMSSRKDYINSLQETRKTGNMNFFYSFMCNQQNRFLEEKILEYKNSNKRGFHFLL
ncbi:MAG: Fic family protein [Mangrovibacterium sp.]